MNLKATYCRSTRTTNADSFLDGNKWPKTPPTAAQRTDTDAIRFSRKILEEARQKGVSVLIDTTLGNAEGAKAMIVGLRKEGYSFEMRAVRAINHPLHRQVWLA